MVFLESKFYCFVKCEKCIRYENLPALTIASICIITHFGWAINLNLFVNPTVYRTKCIIFPKSISNFISLHYNLCHCVRCAEVKIHLKLYVRVFIMMMISFTIKHQDRVIWEKRFSMFSRRKQKWRGCYL